MRYICLLRAINVGGHNVTMADLRKTFEALEFAEVETFIASGNVIFEARRSDSARLERRIESALKDALGYGVDTFLRSAEELRKVVEHEPFPRATIQAAIAFNVAFTNTGLTSMQREKLADFNSDIDEFATHGREIYWLCKTKQSRSEFSSARLERSLALRVTWRGINTVRRLSEKYPPA